MILCSSNRFFESTTVPATGAHNEIVYEIPVLQNMCYVTPIARNQVHFADTLPRPSSMVENNAYNVHQQWT